MNLVEIFGLLGTLFGAFLGVLAALLVGRWLLGTPTDGDVRPEETPAPRRSRLGRALLAILRGPADPLH
jgi:hypothetical protein